MKRIVSLLFALFCLSTAAIAQESLDGTWRISMNMMGINATGVMIFEGANSGVVTEKMDMSMDFKFLGNRMTGKMKASHKGNFVLEGNVLTLKSRNKEGKTETETYTRVTE